MACPFFVPTRKLDDAGWLHPSRLPLAAGWQGQCSAPGHEGAQPAERELRQFCNLGYATNCSWLPQERWCDAVRFSVARDRGSHVLLWFVFESRHRPAGHGTLEFDVAIERWTEPHPDARIQRMAECYLESYLSRRIRPAPADPTSRPNS